MPDLDALAAEIGAQLAAVVQPMLAALRDDMLAQIAAAQVRSALIDRAGHLVLTFGDGDTRNLGPVVGADGAPGAPGADGAPGSPGEPGQPGEQGPPGTPAPEPPLAPLVARLDALEGRMVGHALIDQTGALVFALKDGTTLAAGQVAGRDGANGTDGAPGRDGTDGAPGAPGLGFDDLEVGLAEDGRTVVLAFTRADMVRRFELPLPAMVYRGVYETGRAYVPGDTVTFGGSSWVCNAGTSERPGDNVKAWTLAVKRGRDGKDFAGPQLKVAS